MKTLLPRGIRFLLRRVFRLVIGYGPRFLKKMALRVPFSRFHKIAVFFFWGEEKITWRRVFVKVNPADILGWYVYFLGTYSEEIEKLIELSRDARIFADVGASIGLFSLSLARAHPQLEVFAFEPCRELAKEFRNNVHLNPDLSPKIHLVEKAVADVEGNLFFQPSTNPENPHIGRLVTCVTDYIVPSIRLDNFFEAIGRYPDVVKIDVEGAELRVLEGMRNLFDKCYPWALLVEVHSDWQQDALEFNTKIKRILEEANFHLFRFKNRNWEKLDPPEDWAGRSYIFGIRR